MHLCGVMVMLCRWPCSSCQGLGCSSMPSAVSRNQTIVSSTSLSCCTLVAYIVIWCWFVTWLVTSAALGSLLPQWSAEVVMGFAGSCVLQLLWLHTLYH